MDFTILVDAFDRMTKTSSRLDLTSILVEVIKKTPKEVISEVVYLTQGKLFPDFVGIEIGMAEKTTAKAIETAYGAEPSKITELMRVKGDLGDVAAELSEKRSQMSFFTEELTVEHVYYTLAEIARTTGSGSANKRISKLVMLLNSATSLEAKFLIRFITGKLRLGVADFTVLDSLSIAFTESKENRQKLENAYNLTSDLGRVARVLALEGIQAIEKIEVTTGNPVRPMLAERMSSSEEIIEQFNEDASVEYKLDGERIQAHKTKDDRIILYSRRLEKITNQYMDVVLALKSVNANEFIVEGEVVAIDKFGKYLPFQELMHRRRKFELEKAMKDYPVQINLFDILFFNGESTINQSYESRRNLLQVLFKRTRAKDKIMLVPSRRVSKASEIDALMEESLVKGCEGLVVKDPGSPYRAGARGYAWVKYKPEYRSGVRDTLDLVIVGANHGKGRRAGVYGTYLLAAYDRESDIFRTTTKVGTGFSDENLETISRLLDNHKLTGKSPRVDSRIESEVWFEPITVIEIIASEITLSPIYTAGLDLVREGSGLALRFPKFTGMIRDDKSPEDATTVSELLNIYRKQVRQFTDTGAPEEW
ncbi:MAG: ATP-dependent DNA ligase [Nitrososphaerota archaeon]|nr:ATP-dependent DNA ligase [Nitrososphaerota archaeon]